jgi:hypothetical protein
VSTGRGLNEFPPFPVVHVALAVARAICLSNSGHLPLKVYSNWVKPVAWAVPYS